MAEKQELDIRIGPDGEVEITVLGAKGKQCLLWTKDLEKALGEVKDREMKSEYYQAGPGDQAVQIDRS